MNEDKSETFYTSFWMQKWDIYIYFLYSVNKV